MTTGKFYTDIEIERIEDKAYTKGYDKDKEEDGLIDPQTFLTVIENDIRDLMAEHANVARHGDTPDDAYIRVLDYIDEFKNPPIKIATLSNKYV